jgi:thiol-disulfide isomerase/thioredoxin
MTRLIQSLIRSDQAQAAMDAVEAYADRPGANQRQLHHADALALAGRGEGAAALLAQWIDTEELTGGNRRVIEVAAQQLERLSLIGKPLPAFQKTGYPDDAAISPATFKGTVLLIDFWASWCGPCMAQMPHLVKIHQRLHGDGFQILGISLDDDETKMTAALKRVGATWPQYYDGKRWENDLAVLFDVHRVPQTILVDRKGIVRAVDPPPPAVDRLVTDLLGEDAQAGGL